MKKPLTIMLSLIMVMTVAAGLTACKKESGYDYEITVWVGEGTDELTKRQIERFNETNEDGIKFGATVEVVTESRAVGNASSTPASCADLFCFAQDQLARAVHVNLLMSLNTASVKAITDNCDADSVEAAKIGDTIRAFPLTRDNGYFLYYDKNVVPEGDVGSLEKIIADCEAAGKYFSFNLTDTGGGWYSAAFFYGAGCKSEWTTDKDGNFTGYEDDFNSDKGLVALKGMQKLLKSSAYHESAEVSDMWASIPSGAVVSGIWGLKAAQERLGDDLGIAPLPSFTVDGVTYPLVSYLGNKFMGVKPQSDAYRAAYLQKLAIFLTSEECQRERFETVGWGPANVKAAEGATSPALDVLLKQQTTTAQGQYPEGWWAKMITMVGSAKTSASDDVTLSSLLSTYGDSLNGFLS